MPRENDRKRAERYGVLYEPVNRQQVFSRDGWVCQLCGKPVDPELLWPALLSKSLDHRIPMAKGGPHTEGNCQLAHLICNVRKGAALLAQGVME